MSVRSFFGRSIASLVREINLAFTDITTADASTSKHGLLPKLPGNTTTFLRGDGTFTTVGGGSGGGLVLLEEHTASNSTSLDFTSWYSSSYDDYIIEFVSIIPASNSDLWMRVSTDGGSTYDSGTNYGWTIFQSWGASQNSVGGSVGQNQLVVCNALTTVSNQTMSGRVQFFNPVVSAYKNLMGQFSGEKSDTLLHITLSSGLYTSTTAVNAFRVLMSTGNIASGTVRVYGLAK